MKVVFRPAAERDIDEARGWYRVRSSEVETSFVDAISATLEIVVAHPLAFPQIERGIRRARISTFPYVVYYLPKGDTIRVLAVVHTARRPDTWKRRRR
jgi:plasmid stabilization system protein ParE